MRDIFLDEQGQPRILLGTAVNSGSPRTVELAGRMGFDTVWIEMDHASADLSAAEAMCTAAQAGGALPLVRTSGCRRDQILHALEIGARILVIPVVNTVETALEVVRHGKFRPVGERGYNIFSRGINFGIDPLPFARVNEETYLFPQVETCEAAANVKEILSVDGIAGVFIGPGDLSVNLGRPGDFTNPELQKTVNSCIRAARKAGKHAGIFSAPGPLLDAAVTAGADLCIISSDFTAIIDVWRKQLAEYRTKTRQGG